MTCQMHTWIENEDQLNSRISLLFLQLFGVFFYSYSYLFKRITYVMCSRFARQIGKNIKSCMSMIKKGFHLFKHGKLYLDIKKQGKQTS
jgi:hypothetical protein